MPSAGLRAPLGTSFEAAAARIGVSAYAARIALITAIGLALRVLWVGHEPIWRDEAFTAIVAQRDIPGMLQAIRLDSAPPLSYLITHVFVVMLGASPAALRVAPAIIGALLIPIVAALTRRCAGDRAGIVAAFICALAPALVMSSRDARMYAMATTLVALSSLALWRASERSSALRWTVYGAALLLALYTQYFALLVIPAQLLALRLVLRASWRAVALASAVAALCVAALVPWLAYAAPQFQHAESPFWVQPLGLTTTAGTFAQFLAGPPIEPGTPGGVYLLVLQGFSLLAATVVTMLLIRRRPIWSRPAIFIAVCGAVPIAELAAVSLWHPLLEARYASVVWGVLFGVLALAVAAIRRVRMQVLLVLTLVVPTAGFSVAVTHPNTPALVSYLEPRLQANDFVWSSAGDYLLLYYSGDAALRAHTHVVAHHIAWFWGTAAFPPDAVTPTFPSRTIEGGGTIYYVDDAGHKLPNPPSRYALSRYQCYGTICLATYTAGAG